MTTATTTTTNYVLVARSWFDKSGGNSYYSLLLVKPDLDSEVIVTFAYGHGNGTYINSARIFLGLDRDYSGVRFFVDETKVARRKDLHNGGK